METNSQDNTPALSIKEPVKVIAKNKVNSEFIGTQEGAAKPMGKQTPTAVVTPSANLMKNQVVPEAKAQPEAKQAPAIDEKKALIAESKKLEETKTPTAEAKKPEAESAEKTEEEKKDQLSPRFAQLAKREKAIVEKEKAVKEQLTQLQSFQKNVAEIKGNPKKALEILQKEFAISFDDLAQAILTDGQTTPDFEVKQLKKQIEDDKLAQQKLREESEARNIAQFKKQIETYIDSNNEAYELIRANNAHHLVFDVISENFDKTGTIMKTEDAAKMVEDFYFEQLKKQMQAKKLNLTSTDTKEVKLSASAGQASEEDEKLEPIIKSSRAKTKAKTKTITNQKTISIPNYAKSASHSTERTERIKAALAQAKIKK